MIWELIQGLAPFSVNQTLKTVSYSLNIEFEYSE